MLTPTCLVSFDDIPTSLENLKKMQKDAYLVRTTQGENKTPAYFFIIGEESLKKLPYCPITRQLEYDRLLLKDLNANYLNALMAVTPSGASSPDSNELEKKWKEISEKKTDTPIPQPNWEGPLQFRSPTRESGRGPNITADMVHSNADLSGERISLANFSNLIAISARFINTDISWTNFSNTNLTNANFTAANVCSSNFSNANLANANFGKAHIDSISSFSNADLTNTSFKEATIDDIIFKGAKLINAKFTNAICSSVDFTGSDLRGTCFRGAHVVDTVFTGTIYQDYPLHYFGYIKENSKTTALALLNDYAKNHTDDTFISKFINTFQTDAAADGSNFVLLYNNCLQFSIENITSIHWLYHSAIPRSSDDILKIFEFAKLTSTVSEPPDLPNQPLPNPALTMNS